MKTHCRPSCRPGSTRAGLKWAGRASGPGRRAQERSPGLLLLQFNLLQQALRTYCEPHFRRPLRLASEQAARLAAETGFPLLVFPELFLEFAIPAMVETEYRLNGGFRFASRYQ